ncbi:MAG: hypothetical protein ACFC03_00670 [Candidatus Malihini olakiniferum]
MRAPSRLIKAKNLMLTTLNFIEERSMPLTYKVNFLSLAFTPWGSIFFIGHSCSFNIDILMYHQP